MQTGTFCAFHSPSSRRTEFCYESVGTDLLCCNIFVCLLFSENVCRECDETVLWFSTPVLNVTVTVYKHFENTFAGGLSSANFVNVSTSVFIKYIFFRKFSGTFSYRQIKLKDLLFAIIHWLISLWGTLYCFLQNFARVIDSIFYGRKSLTDKIFAGDCRLLAGALIYICFRRQFKFL
jgi:hypothetical protein